MIKSKPPQTPTREKTRKILCASPPLAYFSSKNRTSSIRNRGSNRGPVRIHGNNLILTNVLTASTWTSRIPATSSGFNMVFLFPLRFISSKYSIPYYHSFAFSILPLPTINYSSYKFVNFIYQK